MIKKLKLPNISPKLEYVSAESEYDINRTNAGLDLIFDLASKISKKTRSKHIKQIIYDIHRLTSMLNTTHRKYLINTWIYEEDITTITHNIKL